MPANDNPNAEGFRYSEQGHGSTNLSLFEIWDLFHFVRLVDLLYSIKDTSTV